MANPLLGLTLAAEQERRALIAVIEALQAGQTAAGGTQLTGAVADVDLAATTGTAVNIVPNTRMGSKMGHLESTSLGNANANHAIDAGIEVVIVDNDTPGGVTLYFDEDGVNQDSDRFMAVLPAAKDCLVPLINGDFIRVKHDALAATNGVQVYFDDDAASALLRLMFVSPTDTEGVFQTDNGAGIADTASVALSEVTLDLTKLDVPTKKTLFEQKADGTIVLQLIAA